VTADANGQIRVFVSYGASGTPLVNGLEVVSGGTTVQKISAGLLPGGTFTVNTGLSNQGTLSATNGDNLVLNRLESSSGNIQVGAGSTVTVNGDLNLTPTSATSVDITGTASEKFGHMNVTGNA